jgi:hypothetical protein
MLSIGRKVLIGLLALGVTGPAIAATAPKPAATAAKPAATATAAPAAAAAAPAATGTPATGVVCQVATGGKVVHVQAVNKGTAVVPAGDTFAFTIVGHKKSMSETVTLKSDLAPGKSVNVTNAIKPANVVSCTPTS